MAPSEPFVRRLRRRLREIYGDAGESTADEIVQLVERFPPSGGPADGPLWDERDVVLIAYGDQIRADSVAPLASLNRFLSAHGLDRLISTLHLLPFFPSSSDDGFSVIDYRAVDPALGSWSDIEALGERFELMFDLVLNHVSRQSSWFQDYLAGREPYSEYFIEVEPTTDTSQVTRPRSRPLLTPFNTSRGRRNLWTTFSPDQVDLNYGNPRLLIEMIDVLLFYLRHGARIVRLDAIAYLWKTPGTSCIHLPQTHAVVKLLRDLLQQVAPRVLLLTETNVPHAENVSYFGNGDEAHIVYQFPLAPLLLDAFLNRDAGALVQWLSALQEPSAGTTYLNFTASHDGVGLRPLEGLVSRQRIENLAEAVAARGGRVSTRANEEGGHTPYELNISYFDALGEADGVAPELHVARFLASQAIVLALQGIPAVYFHSLLGTPNDDAGVAATGRARSINRRKYESQQLDTLLSSPHTPQAMVFEGYKHLLSVRRGQPAFHPQASQQVLPLEQPSVVGFQRSSLDGRQTILILANLADRPTRVDAAKYCKLAIAEDLLTGAKPLGDGGGLMLQPYQVVWLESSRR